MANLQVRKSLLSSGALIQTPWIKVTIGNFTFGVFSKTKATKNAQNFYSSYNIQYPNYVQDLSIVKINGQVNQYTLSIAYPVRVGDDPNFFEKVFSSVSKSRKIVFSYGDASMPTYVYKDEEAIITNISTSFSFGSSGAMNSVLHYTISATSSAALSSVGSFTFINNSEIKPSDEIKRIFRDSKFGLRGIFTGMSDKNIDALIDGSDKKVKIESKTNISPIDYITYLVSCMVPSSSTNSTNLKDLYLLTLHDDTVYDAAYNDSLSLGGPYFKVTRVSKNIEYGDAYEIDLGFNTSTIVRSFSLNNSENYSLYYDYANSLYPEEYKRVLNNKGEWEDIYAPTVTSNNSTHTTRSEDLVWYSKITQYPVKASITIQGLLRPASLLTYLRLNVIFPGGIGTEGTRKHISSGLYLITKQTDRINSSGYTTDLELVKISN